MPEKEERVKGRGMLRYRTGDATRPERSTGKVAVICHVVNDAGHWNSGFVRSLSNRWDAPEQEYRKDLAEGKLSLGRVQIVKVGEDLYVANMVAQRGIQGPGNLVPLVNHMMLKCLSTLATRAKELGPEGSVEVFCPRMGSERAGGDWKFITEMIRHSLCKSGFPVTVYTLPQRGPREAPVPLERRVSGGVKVWEGAAVNAREEFGDKFSKEAITKRSEALADRRGRSSVAWGDVQDVVRDMILDGGPLADSAAAS